jgi:hypothetical protein
MAAFMGFAILNVAFPRLLGTKQAVASVSSGDDTDTDTPIAPYNAFMSADGNQSLKEEDPHVVQQQILAKCTVAGQPAMYGWFIYNSLVNPEAPAQGRRDAAKLFVIARIKPDGTSREMMWRGAEYKSVTDNTWTSAWGCKL